MPERAYLNALLQDLTLEAKHAAHRDIQSIFIGGGTPSLFSPKLLAELLHAIKDSLNVSPNIEITLEANPGTVDQAKFAGFREAGVNRLSLGIQSFQADKLKTLGRIHNADDAKRAIEAAFQAGFENINIDLMYGLSDQTLDDALYDLSTALSFHTTHLSWYQLTLEPNTVFYRQPPPLPPHDAIAHMQMMGQAYLNEHGFQPYEISAYRRQDARDYRCQHNLNYWLFGDYLAIGAGAHGKITQNGQIKRYWKTRHPKDYLNSTSPFLAGEKMLTEKDISLEFMMNALRLYQPLPVALYESRTGLRIESIEPLLRTAMSEGFLTYDGVNIETTFEGKQYLNELLERFL